MADEKLVDGKTIGTGIGGIALVTACAIFAPQFAEQAQQEKMVAEAKCVTVEATEVKGQSQYKFNPLMYIDGGTRVKVIVQLPDRNDSTIFIGNYISSADTTSLIDVNVNLQPSAPTEPSKPVTDGDLLLDGSGVVN